MAGTCVGQARPSLCDTWRPVSGVAPALDSGGPLGLRRRLEGSIGRFGVAPARELSADPCADEGALWTLLGLCWGPLVQMLAYGTWARAVDGSGMGW
ncbi:hypothetical protein NDU88_006063 [Pleurodeles waltl]|uniref:Uncharacterized protein n=1 Tax=Pleurodeles waltl TaxID=8319 RepID=A0AAV7TZ13_PLEWA|nr:hypothetical protein NDU88_006063 [Pleurodeles waltl]